MPTIRNQNETPYPRIVPAGETAWSVEFGDAVDDELNRRAHAFDRLLQTRPPAGFVESVPSYRAVLVQYDPCVIEAGEMRQALQDLLNETPPVTDEISGRCIEIPVRYGGECGPDLADVAQHCGLTPEEVIRRHTSPTYRIAMLGFAPGFTYLLGLPCELATPRLATPRLSVPAGSVGIAGDQTGIYALSTPGGWRIIGRTALSLFDAARESPFILQPGDRVQFTAEQ